MISGGVCGYGLTRATRSPFDVSTLCPKSARMVLTCVQNSPKGAIPCVLRRNAMGTFTVQWPFEWRCAPCIGYNLAHVYFRQPTWAVREGGFRWLLLLTRIPASLVVRALTRAPWTQSPSAIMPRSMPTSASIAVPASPCARPIRSASRIRTYMTGRQRGRVPFGGPSSCLRSRRT